MDMASFLTGVVIFWTVGVVAIVVLIAAVQLLKNI